MEPFAVIEVHNTLGEGVLWDDQTQCVWWTDIEERNLYRLDWASRDITVYNTPERLGSFGLTDVPGCLVAAFETGFALYWPAEERVKWFDRPARYTPGIRFNDGRVDRQGRFWAGTMVESSDPALSAALYRLDTDGSVSMREQGVRISNGLCWSPDSRTMYFADSPAQALYAYDFDAADGAPSHRRTLVTLEGRAYPDGACVDAAGNIWSATWASHEMRCYSPEGETLRSVCLPVSQPSCPAFGGPDLDLLFVTTAQQGLSEAALAGEPMAGSLFVYDIGVTGLPEPRFPAINHINVQ